MPKSPGKSFIVTVMAAALAMLATTRPASSGAITCDARCRHGEYSAGTSGDLRLDGSRRAGRRFIIRDRHLSVHHAGNGIPLNRPGSGEFFGILLLRAEDYSRVLRGEGSSDYSEEGRWRRRAFLPDPRATCVRRAGIYVLDIARPPNERWGWVDVSDIFDPSKLSPEPPTVGLILLACITFLPIGTHART
jgi:hypothetical protein